MDASGQPAIVGNEFLREYLTTQLPRTAAGAWLLIGPHHVGKSTVVQALARQLVCTETTDTACGTCLSCTAWREAQHPDVVHLAPVPGATTISIERIRPESSAGDVPDDTIVSRLSRRPLLSRRMVVCIEQAETLTTAAGNALLKLLEEPPASTLFLLTADSEQSILPTIRSRCAVVRFGRLPVAELSRWLQDAHGLTPSVATRRARQSQGLPGAAVHTSDDTDTRAQALLEQFKNSTHNPFFLGASMEKEALADPENIRTLGQLLDDVILLSHGLTDRLTFPHLRASITAIAERQTPTSLAVCGQAYRRLQRRLQRHVSPITAFDSFSNAYAT